MIQNTINMVFLFDLRWKQLRFWSIVVLFFFFSLSQFSLKGFGFWPGVPVFEYIKIFNLEKNAARLCLGFPLWFNLFQKKDLKWKLYRIYTTMDCATGLQFQWGKKSKTNVVVWLLKTGGWNCGFLMVQCWQEVVLRRVLLGAYEDRQPTWKEEFVP